MSKVKNNEKNNKNEKKDVFDNSKIIKIFAIFVAVVFLVLFCLCFVKIEFIPATMIALSLELFSISYYFYEKNSERKLVYSTFIVGVIVLMVSVVYTLVSII